MNPWWEAGIRPLGTPALSGKLTFRNDRLHLPKIFIGKGKRTWVLTGSGTGMRPKQPITDAPTPAGDSDVIMTPRGLNLFGLQRSLKFKVNRNLNGWIHKDAAM